MRSLSTTASTDMRMEDPIPTFTYLVSKALERHPDLAYLSIVEPGVGGASDIEAREGEVRLSASCHHKPRVTCIFL